MDHWKGGGGDGLRTKVVDTVSAPVSVWLLE